MKRPSGGNTSSINQISFHLGECKTRSSESKRASTFELKTTSGLPLCPRHPVIGSYMHAILGGLGVGLQKICKKSENPNSGKVGESVGFINRLSCSSE